MTTSPVQPSFISWEPPGVRTLPQGQTANIQQPHNRHNRYSLLELSPLASDIMTYLSLQDFSFCRSTCTTLYVESAKRLQKVFENHVSSNPEYIIYTIVKIQDFELFDVLPPGVRNGEGRVWPDATSAAQRFWFNPPQHYLEKCLNGSPGCQRAMALKPAQNRLYAAIADSLESSNPETVGKAMQAFSRMSIHVNKGIFWELRKIQDGELTSWEQGQSAFFEEHGKTSTPGQRAQAIRNYLNSTGKEFTLRIYTQVVMTWHGQRYSTQMTDHPIEFIVNPGPG